jgi:hypothetical protein
VLSQESNLVSEGYLEAAFESWVGVVPLGLCTCSWRTTGEPMNLWQTEQVDVKVCLFAFEIKELSQAEAARL